MVFEALIDLDRDPARPWLELLDDEIRPRVLDADSPATVLWLKRPDARLRLDLQPDSGGQGADLCWTLLVDEPAPDDALVGHLRKRVNQLINANLRYTFGQ